MVFGKMRSCLSSEDFTGELYCGTRDSGEWPAASVATADAPGDHGSRTNPSGLVAYAQHIKKGTVMGVPVRLVERRDVGN